MELYKSQTDDVLCLPSSSKISKIITISWVYNQNQLPNLNRLYLAIGPSFNILSLCLCNLSESFGKVV